MTNTNMVFQETVIGDWSMKNGATLPMKRTPGGRRRNKAGTQTM